ncbi:MAG TPA: serine hydrolase domain-containing protein [Streptosporangiaceae bacterium]|nr:serine hydrolase domain-containing protein [Streptosporangiaceae bacterium]
MTVNQVPAGGFVAPGFEAVREAFSDIIAADGELGASLGVYADGEKMVDLRGGLADPATGRPWGPDTVSVIFSATKGAVAILAWLLAQRGVLDFGAPVTAYWPEFGRGGKSAVPVRYLFTHQAGLPYLDRQLSREEVLDGSRIVEVLQQQAPVWEPGNAHGYHALTYGWLAGALIRKATGQRLGQVFAEEVAGPLGLDFCSGLPAGQEGRVARLIEAPPPDPRQPAAGGPPELKATLTAQAAAAQDPQSPVTRALSAGGALPTPDAATWNDPRVYQSEIPAANGIANGPSLARLYAATVSEIGGIRLLSQQTIDKARAEQVNGPDQIMMFPTRYGTGFQLPTAGEPLLSPDSFGRTGAGGLALGFADARHRIGFGYVQNRLLSMPAGRPHARSLIAAVREAVGA